MQCGVSPALTAVVPEKSQLFGYILWCGACSTRAIICKFYILKDDGASCACWRSHAIW